MADKTTYWRIRQDDGSLAGLIRRRDRDGSPVELAYLREDGWHGDLDLATYWLDPGDRELAEVTLGEAVALAGAQGYQVDGEAA